MSFDALDPVMLISAAAFVGAAALAAAIIAMVSSFGATRAEDRLDVLAGNKPADSDSKGLMKDEMIRLSQGAMKGFLGTLSDRIGNWNLFFEQADSPVSFETFLLLCAGCGFLGVGAAVIGNAPIPMYPACGLFAAMLPLWWMNMRRSWRFSKFGKQLPDAMELVARALRSGHSLSSGLHVVVEEMPDPISHEFNLAYEQQNLGVPIEGALKSMIKRMPNLDLKFFVTAVAIQRQTGGDLAEILDKIGYVIRERFKILGTVQALTGEGRLSGIVLMAMPIAIFFAVYYLNPDYVMLLFTTELGKKMIAVGIIMQVLGAVCIKKIIDIKV
ncbi:MAG: type II secretion system F family protein [Planctomycetaceae bacterium]|nr:type II secretion system F family protein [Planctomycetaceae bacterium]